MCGGSLEACHSESVFPAQVEENQAQSSDRKLCCCKVSRIRMMLLLLMPQEAVWWIVIGRVYLSDSNSVMSMVDIKSGAECHTISNFALPFSLT